MVDYDGILNNGAFLRLTIDQISQNIEGNYSTIHWGLTLHRGSNTASYNYGGTQWITNINGNVYSGSYTFDFRSDAYVVLGSGFVDVPHNADGTKHTYVRGYTGDTGTAVGGPVYTPETNFVQTTIPRASTPSLSADPITAGTSVTINTNRASSSFTHTIRWGYGSLSGTIASSVGASTTWTPPLTLLEQNPNSVSGSGVIWTDTYNGATLIGTTAIGFTLSAPSSVVPTFTTVTHSETVSAVNTAVGAYVQGLSKLALAITGAAGVYGSTITSYKITVSGQTINASSGTTPNAISASGTVAIVGTITDSRGRTASKTINITVLPYALPAISSVQFRRALAAGTVDEEGTYIRVDLTAAVQSLTVSSTQKNTLTYKVFTRVRGASTWVQKINTTHSSISYNSSILVSSYDVMTSYEVLVQVIDKFNTVSVQGVIAVAQVFMHWSPTGMGVGKFWEQGALDVYGEIFHKQGEPVGVPAGTIAITARSSAPTGWLLADGSNVSRTTYADLFAAIGTTYGAGNGSTTFALPNLKGRVPVGIDTGQTEFDTRGETGGAKTHTLTLAQSPAHSHRLGFSEADDGVIDAPLVQETSSTPHVGWAVGLSGTSGGFRLGITDTKGGSTAHNNLQPYISLHYMIKT